MLDAYIIEDIRRQQREAERQRQERPRLHIDRPRRPEPVEDHREDEAPEPEEEGPIRIQIAPQSPNGAMPR